VASGVDGPGTVVGVTSVVVGKGGSVTEPNGVDVGLGTTVLDELAVFGTEPGDVIRVERAGSQVLRLDVLPGVSVELAVRLPRIGTLGLPPPPAAEPADDGGATARLDGMAKAGAEG